MLPVQYCYIQYSVGNGSKTITKNDVKVQCVYALKSTLWMIFSAGCFCFFPQSNLKYAKIGIWSDRSVSMMRVFKTVMLSETMMLSISSGSISIPS